MKREYIKPEIKSEKMFEKTVLGCNKCQGNGNSSHKCSGTVSRS